MKNTKIILTLVVTIAGCVGVGIAMNMTRTLDDYLVDHLKNKQNEVTTTAEQGIYIQKEIETLKQRKDQFDSKYKQLIIERDEIINNIKDKGRVPQFEDVLNTYYKDKDEYSINVVPKGGAEEPNIVQSNGYAEGYTGVDSLFYTCLKTYKCYVTQGDLAHQKRNNLIATDIGTNFKNVPVVVPDYQGREVEYTVNYISYEKTTGLTVELTADIDGKKVMWKIGHIHWNFDSVDYYAKYQGKTIKTGQVVAMSGGERNLSYHNGGSQGATSGHHVHIEYLEYDNNEWVQKFYRVGDDTVATTVETGGVEKKCQNFVVTAYYSPLPGQKKYNKGNFEAEKILQGNGTNGASGKEVFDGMMAAPKTYAFGTKIEINGKVYTVEDRGGAIVPAGQRGYKYDRLDIWMGKGDEGRIAANEWGKRTVEGCFVS